MARDSTVRQLLELRPSGYDLARILIDHPELRTVGVAAAFTYASKNRDQYAEFFETDGSHPGPRLQRGGGRRTACPVPPARHRHQKHLTPGVVARRLVPLLRQRVLSRSVLRCSKQPSENAPRMTDTRTTEPTTVAPADDAAGAAAPAFDPERRATELAILDALRAVVDPEIGMNVVELALIKQILLALTRPRSR